MKVRSGFVSNSSSSSFAIPLRRLTVAKVDKIRNHIEVSKKLALRPQIFWKDYDAWDIFIENGWVIGSTIMDNFPMEDFLEAISVDMDRVQWEFIGNLYPCQGKCEKCKHKFTCLTEERDEI